MQREPEKGANQWHQWQRVISVAERLSLLQEASSPPLPFPPVTQARVLSAAARGRARSRRANCKCHVGVMLSDGSELPGQRILVFIGKNFPP